MSSEPAPEAQTPNDPAVIPLVEESLRLEKMATDRGGYRITKRVTTSDQRVNELLRDREVRIERRPVGKPVEGGSLPLTRYEGDTLVIPVVREVLVTEKRLVLVEEVRVTAIEGSHREAQTVTLRKEEIAIERLAPETNSASDRD
jgi:uncharacterized protein (TIGR02271 family)